MTQHEEPSDAYGAEYSLCKAIGGRCGCAERQQPPCDTIQDMIGNGETEGSEARRISDMIEQAKHEAE